MSSLVRTVSGDIPSPELGVTNAHDHLFLRFPLLAGGDTTTAAARSVTAGPGMPGLLASFGRRIAAEIGADGWNAMTVSNPARAFSLRER